MRHPEHNFLEDEQKVSQHGNPQYTGNSSVSCYPGWLAWETARDLEILSLPWACVLEWTLRTCRERRCHECYRQSDIL